MSYTFQHPTAELVHTRREGISHYLDNRETFIFFSSLYFLADSWMKTSSFKVFFQAAVIRVKKNCKKRLKTYAYSAKREK